MPVVSSTQYADQTDLTTIGLTAGALTNFTSPQLDGALMRASAVADSYLQSRYDLPLSSWGKDLARCVAIIAAYDLLSVRGYNPNAAADVNWRQRYLDQLAWLEQVSKGIQSPAYIADSSTTASGPSTGTSTDGSIVTSTQGGFGMVTSPVRGWTNRGASSPGWDSGDGF